MGTRASPDGVKPASRAPIDALREPDGLEGAATAIEAMIGPAGCLSDARRTSVP